MDSDERDTGSDVNDREYEPNPDDEREVDLSDEPELVAPPTLDPEERVEDDEDEDPEIERGDGPVAL
jgi:hypothetical protein